MTSRTVDLGRATWVSLALATATAVGCSFTSVGSPLDVALGGAFMAGDFFLIRTLVSRLIRPGSSRALTFLLLQAKFLLLLLLFAAVVMQWNVAPGSFAVGASMLLAALVLEATVLGRPVGPLGPEPDEAQSGR